MAGHALAGDVEIPDYVGHYLDTAFAHAVRRRLGIPKLIDKEGRRVRVTSLADWKVVRQADTADCMVFEIEGSD